MIEEIYQVLMQSSGVSTDTRTIKENQLFFALRGPNFDGNVYVQKALENGAIAVVSDGDKVLDSDKIIYVEDALVSLQQLANHHRKQFSIPIIGLTGSNGKTTTKELLSVVLKQRYNTLSTSGNLNNHIGVPLTLLKITNEHEIAVVEMGANKVGDIAELCAIAEPTHGLITSIGRAHLEGFGSVEGVIKGKSELYRFLHQSSGIVFVNNQLDYLWELVPTDTETIFFGGKDSELYISEIKSSNPLTFRLTYKGNLFEVKSHLFGSFHQNNILYAIQVGLFFHVPMEDVLKAITSYVPANNRSEQREWNSNKVLLDAYNANPSSMISAIEEFVVHVEGDKLLILGDMFELGIYAEEEHQRVVDLVESNNIEAVLIGAFFFKTDSNIPNISKFKTLEEAKVFLTSRHIINTSILVKGSRSMTLEKLFDYK